MKVGEVTEECPKQNVPIVCEDSVDLDRKLGISFVKTCHDDLIGDNVRSFLSRDLSKLFEKELPKYSEFDQCTIKEVSLEEINTRLKKLGKILFSNEFEIVLNSGNYFYNILLERPSCDLRAIMLRIYASKMEFLEEGRNAFLEVFKDLLTNEALFCDITWFFYLPGGPGYKQAHITESLNDEIFYQAYPYLNLEEVASNYLSSDEPILVLVGPPGTGKTRLIRYILIEMAKKLSKNERLEVALTADRQIIESGSIFLSFISQSYNALVLEDIDYHMGRREEGNTAMYHLLSVSNGLAVNSFSSKKIILSTNLANTNKVDQALIRPGRCFDILQTRKLTKKEALYFLESSFGITTKLPEGDIALSDLYRIINKRHSKRDFQKKVGFY